MLKKHGAILQNLGYPINDTYDNENIAMVSDGMCLCICHKRRWLWNKDIYKNKV